jgi:hypothetical protein
MFLDKELQILAVKHGFYQRKSKFSPIKFFEMLMYSASQNESCTLEQSSMMLKTSFKLDITKQSLNARFNDGSIKFVKEILKRVIEKQLSKVINDKFLTQFNQIRIKDATRIVLPDRLKEYYKGYGGGSKESSKAGICIQFEYDAKNGKILSLDITHATRNDNTDAKETITNVNSGDLILRDLGYYSLPNLESIDNSDAFFISRLGAKTNVYENEKILSFRELYKTISINKQTCIEVNVIVGKKEQIPMRLVISIVPNDVYEKRIRKIDQRNKNHGYQTSDDYKYRCRFNLFITNIETQNLTKEQVLILYKLRWQIELMFKNWKSISKIDEIQPMKYARFTCVFIAKLILIVINIQLIWNFASYYYQKNEKILSIVKCFKTLQREAVIVIEILRKKKKESENNIKKIGKLFSSNHWTEKKKDSTNYEDILELFICNSN